MAGLAIERGVLRLMYGRDEVIMVLVTYAVFLVLEDVIKLIWGVDPYFAYQPYGLLGTVDVLGLPYPVYDLATHRARDRDRRASSGGASTGRGPASC